MICAKAIDPAEIPHAYSWIFKRIMSVGQHEGLRTAEFGRIVRGWADSDYRPPSSGNEGTALIVQAILTGIVATARRRNDSWFTLASDELGIPGSVLRDYAADSNSLSLVILIHITRLQYSHHRKPWWPKDMFSEILEAASKFNVQDTSPKLQREFCALWNHILLKVQNDDDQWMVFRTLGRIRDVYVTLHQDTISAPTKLFISAYNQAITLLEPSLYPLCNVPGHHQDSVPRIHDDSSSTTFACAVLHGYDDTTIVSSFLPSSSPESSARAQLLDDESPRDVPPLDNNVAVPVSSQPIDQTAIEGCCIPATSPYPVATRVTHEGIHTSANTIHLSAPDPSASTNLPPRSKASTSPPDVVAIPHSAHLRTPSDDPDVPSSPSPTLVPDNMSLTESLRAPTAPGPSRPRLSSAPGPDAVVEGEGSMEAALRKEKDALDPPSAIRKNITIPFYPSSHLHFSKI